MAENGRTYVNKIKAENLPQFCLTCKPNTKKCGICNKTIAANHKKLKCKNCHLFVHIKCNETDIKTYDKINHDKMSTICISCQPNNIPFMGLNDLDFIDINNNSPILTHKIHCSICTKTIAKNHRKINCNSCNSYVHIKCNQMDVEYYNKIINLNLPQFCISCNGNDPSTTSATKQKIKCNVCTKTIAKTHRALQCHICEGNVHIKCNKTDAKTFENLIKERQISSV